MFALVDANSFYCSAEQVFRPEWRGKPLIVLSNNDGCIVAANKQAIALGIEKFQPYFKAKSLCEQAGIIACSSNYELYADLSAKMMQVIGRFAPEQHIYSIDESFLSFNHCEQTIADLTLHGQRIRQAVWKETRLPVCVGIGRTLTLAKLANHVAKKWPGFNGVCLLNEDHFIHKVLAQLSPVDVWGIGRKTAQKLKQNGIVTALQLSQTKLCHLPPGFGVQVERTIKELNGEVCIRWDGVRANKLQIFSTRSLGKRITEIDALEQALAKHAGIATVKAREQKSLCATLMLFAANSPFDEKPCAYKVVTQFNPPTNDTSEILKAIRASISQLFQPGVAYYKVGVGLLNLSSEHHQQWDLFNPPKGNTPLNNVLDKINQRYGSNSAFFAAQGIDEQWAMRRALLTPQYTTNWQHIPTIAC